MIQNYLTISEFAKLRNVSIGSLRYYEQLKLLVPARTDPKTGYRYYLPEQLVTLDTILCCIELGIPLKELKNYMDESGSLNQKEILTAGKEAMQKKISEMQAKLEITQYSLDYMEQNEDYIGRRGMYTRYLEERYFLKIPLCGDWRDISENWRIPMEVFREDGVKQMSPVLSPAIALYREEKEPGIFFLLQVLHPDEKDCRVICLPGAEYLCLQAELNFQTDIRKLLAENFPVENMQTALVIDMARPQRQIDIRHSEIQVLLLPRVTEEV